MARYKPLHQGVKLLAVDFDQQILPGTFEHALRHLVDHELDLIIAQHFAVFGELAWQQTRLHRFTLRSKAKVEGQWKLFCLVHNVEKLAHHGYAA